MWHQITMLDEVAAPYKILFIILEILKCLFAKIMTRKPNVCNLTNMTEVSISGVIKVVFAI